MTLRPLVPTDFPAWQEVRRRNDDWLTPWEPARNPNLPDVVESSEAFAMRCSARERERQLGTGFGFGIFVRDRRRPAPRERSAARSTCRRCSGARSSRPTSATGSTRPRRATGYMPEALVLVARFAFEQVRLHRIQVSIIPRNHRSRRVVEKLKLRDEGIAQRYLEINGVWEDHVRYAITVEEWHDRRDELTREWLA